MPVSFGGHSLIDPVPTAERCAELDIPIDWLGRANKFLCPVGPEPGRGLLLLLRGDLRRLNLNALHDLTYTAVDAITGRPSSTVTLKSLLVIKARCLLPGVRGAADAVYLVEVEDRRRLARATAIDKAYNLRQSTSAYLSATLNSGSPWTWAGMVGDIWAICGKLGTFPGLPFTPDGTPEGFTFYGASAYDALNTVLDLLSCALKLDPVADTFSIVRLAATDAQATADLTKADPLRIWDSEPVEGTRARVPAAVLVHFPRVRTTADTTGASPWHTVSVADPSGTLSGVEPGTVAILYDNLSALLDAGGSVTNGSALNSRAAERAADFYREARAGRLHRVYTGGLALPGLRPGALVKGTLWEEVGAGVKTELVRGPGLLSPRLALPGAGGQGGGDVTFYNEENIFQFNSLFQQFINVGDTINQQTFIQQTFQTFQQFISILIQLLGGPGTGGGMGHPWEWFTQKGSTLNRWYSWSRQGQNRIDTLNNQSVNVGLLRAYPFISPRGGTLDRIAVSVTTDTMGGEARVGIYKAASDTELKPVDLIVDSGVIDCSSVGWKPVTINVSLQGGTLYWLCFEANSGSISFKATARGDAYPVFGLPENPGATGLGWEADHTFGALPATFPTTNQAIVPAVSVSDVEVYVRYSA